MGDNLIIPPVRDVVVIEEAPEMRVRVYDEASQPVAPRRGSLDGWLVQTLTPLINRSRLPPATIAFSLSEIVE